MLDLTKLTLTIGNHGGPDSGFCLLEAASYLAREPWSDSPQCVCPVLGVFGRNLNDVLPDDKRQRLVPLIPELLNTRDDGQGETRSYLALDWLIRTYLPTWLSLTERVDPAHAAGIRALSPIVDMGSAQAAGVLVRQARDAARAAWAAAQADAGDAAWDAARATAGDAVRAAPASAAWEAAADGDAASDAAEVAVFGAAGAAAWDAAGAAAWDADGDAAWDADGDAAGAALTPTVDQLQDSAIDLYTRMIRAGRERPEPAVSV